MSTSKFRTILIFCAIFTTKLPDFTDAVTCNFDTDGGFYIFIRDQPNTPSYICNLTTINFGGYENPTEIRGQHNGGSDSNVKIVQGYYPLKLKAITPIFCQRFPNVEVFDMAYTEIEVLDGKSLQNCQKLKLLHLRVNKIRKIPDHLLDTNSRLSNLWLNFNQLTTLPEYIFRSQSVLKGLYLGNNQIHFLPNYIFYYLVKLQYLDLSNNRLQGVNPAWFVNLHILKELSLDSNQISDLPGKVFKPLGNLQSLLLQNNRINNLQPDCFEGLVNLKRLILGNNEIFDLPGRIFAPMRNLQELWVNNNRLSTIHSDSFGVHNLLTTVYFANNKINAIDEKFIYNTHVSYLNMLDNVCYQDEIGERDKIKSYLGRCIENYRPRLIHTGTCGRPVTGHGNIIGGKQISRGAFPWIAALVTADGTFFCGGTIISNQKIVTAAHCIQGKSSSRALLPRDVIVLLGVHDLNSQYEIGRTPIAVQSINIHPDWNTQAENFDSDIAVIVLEDKISFNRYIQPICLIDRGSFIAKINSGVVIGYGKSEDKRKIHENIPKILNFPIHSNTDCFLKNQYLTKLSSKRTFCGGSGRGIGVCRGDSGSGIFVNYGGTYYLRGIVSSSLFTSTNECDVNTYSVFTDIMHFQSWIHSVTPPAHLYNK